MKDLFILTLQWTPLLPVVSIFACENMHSVALGVLSNAKVVLKHCSATKTTIL